MKLTTQAINKAIAKDSERLKHLRVGSKEWCVLFATIEYTKDEIKAGRL